MKWEAIGIVGLEYAQSGQDLQSQREKEEYVLIENNGKDPIDLNNWILQNVGATSSHCYQFREFILAPSAQVRVWAKSGTDTSTDLYAHLKTVVWTNPGESVVLLDPDKLEVSRFPLDRLPPGAQRVRLTVPAFWSLDPKYDQFWQKVRQASSTVQVVVIEGSWPETAKKNSATWKPKAEAHLDTLPGAVLGYVSTRDKNKNFELLPINDILTGPNKLDSVKAWYDQFGSHIDGIYFDELVVPEDPNSPAFAVQLVAQFKQLYPGAKAMVLAGQCIEEKIVTSNVDWVILWEQEEGPYSKLFYPMMLSGAQELTKPIPKRSTLGKIIPPWWKNPKYKSKIVHIIHNCPEAERQRVMSTAMERNAGVIFVMDRRDLNPTTGKYELYDHLPNYWTTEVQEVESYNDFGFDPQRALLAAHRYGRKQQKLHAWPNGEAAWRGARHVRGTFFLDPGAYATLRDVALSDLKTPEFGTPELYDVSTLWYSVHKYAQNQGYETGMPTFEAVQTANGPGVTVLLFVKQLPWLQPQVVQLGATYQQPTFAEPSAVMRNIHRWATSQGHKTGFPTFVPDNVAAPTGRQNRYNCYVITNVAPVSWQDVMTATYIQQL